MYKEVYFSKKKMFIDGLNMDLVLWDWVKQTVHGVETLTQVKKKFWVIIS